MTEFVLIAGAFHGAWAWSRLAPLLEEAGHAAHRIDLTGQGARAHTVTPETDLSTHIEDVVAYFDMEDIERAVLVGHSYSGMVVTGAADRLGDRVSHLVYADAMVPENGQSAEDYSGPKLTAAALAKANGHWLVDNFFPVSKFGPFAREEEERWFLSKLRPHPMKTFFEKLDLRGPTPRQRTFIASTVDPLGVNDAAQEMARTSPDWGYHEIAAKHDAMLTAPRDLATILLSLDA